MKTLHFEYKYKLEFDNPITDQQFQLRCIPRDGTHQKVLDINYKIEPIDTVTRLKDGFGNPIYVGSSLKEHNYFSFSVEGTVICSNTPLIKEGTCYPIYKYSTPLTTPNKTMQEYIKKYTHLDKETAAWSLMHDVYKFMKYEPGSTNVYTTASEAFTLKKGVCQDYSHILIALLRLLDIPARYVAGMMLGEGATHAWVDAYCNNHWIHLDPTNDREADEQYIKLSHGRDFKDCIIDKGVFSGHCQQNLNVYVKVEEIS